MSSMYRSTNAPVGSNGYDDDNLISPRPLDSSPSHASTYSHSLSSQPYGAVNGPSKPHRPSKFLEFPKEVISHFASLCLVNRAWYRQSQHVELYAHHLSRCPSYALSNPVITGPFRRKDDLSRLKTIFAAEVRRNLFDAFTTPRKTLINLIAINTNSSAAFPGGEAFRFEFSPNGRMILALSSSRIYVLDVTADSVVVKRELKTLRRPLSASITDDGTLLAVLSSKFQANIYGIPDSGNVQHLQCIALEHSPRTIAIAHEGTVMAAAYETGIEVFSLAANALTTDRRAVRSEAVDTLNFSGDGSMLVGSALSLDDPNAVVISAPFYEENDPDLSPREVHSRMWTTQILFPQISSVCSHVALIPGHAEGDATWLFAFDHSLLSYRAVRTDDTRTGVAYFHGPPGSNRFSMPSPTIAPTATQCGTLAVAGFSGVGLCLYGIPEKLDVGPDMAAVVERHERKMQTHGPITSATGHMEPLMAYSPSVSGTNESIEDDALASKVDWRQSLFVKCKSVFSLHGHNAAKWVERPESGPSGFYGKRLLVTAPGGVGDLATDLGEETMPVDGSRMCLLDFDYGPSSGEDREITIEVGESQPELLVEPTGTMATEVALERKRTVRRVPGGETSRLLLARSITSISPPSPFFANAADWKPRSNSQPSSPMDESSERRLSASPLQRSVTAAGFRHALYPPRPPLGSQQYTDQAPVASGPGRATSTDSWESPPPPYTDAGQLANFGSGINPMTSAGANAQMRQGPGHPGQNGPNQGPSGFQRSPPPQQAPNFMPYRFMHPRASTGLDGMPTSESAPTRRTMSQHGAFQRSTRFRDPSMTSLDTVAEAWHRQNVKSMDLSSSSSDMGNAGIDGHFARPRPLTHHGGSQQMSPRSPSRAKAQSPSDTVSPISSDQDYSPTSLDARARLSLTGANLQNRLNHPVPPVPEEGPAVALIPESLRPAPQQMIQTHSAPVVPLQPSMAMPYQSPPLPLQANDLNNRVNQSFGPSGAGFPPSPIVRRPVGGASVPATHQPPMNWDSPSMPPNSFRHPHTFPEGISQTHARGPLQVRHALASASVPDLLRPVHHRLDAAEPLSDHHVPMPPSGLGRRVSRARSLIQRPKQEQSAYHETTRMVPNLSFGRRAKADKKRTKNDSSDSGSKILRGKCSVM